MAIDCNVAAAKIPRRNRRVTLQSRIHLVLSSKSIPPYLPLTHAASIFVKRTVRSQDTATSNDQFKHDICVVLNSESFKVSFAHIQEI